MADSSFCHYKLRSPRKHVKPHLGAFNRAAYLALRRRFSNHECQSRMFFHGLRRSPITASTYGPGSSQFGDLMAAERYRQDRLAPLIVFFHGGWWKSEYDLGYAGHLCADLKKHGIAVLVRGVPAGGKHGRRLAGYVPGCCRRPSITRRRWRSYLSAWTLSRVVTMGHSAGGHLAFWVAGRHHIDSAERDLSAQAKGAAEGSRSASGRVQSTCG